MSNQSRTWDTLQFCFSSKVVHYPIDTYTSNSYIGNWLTYSIHNLRIFVQWHHILQLVLWWFRWCSILYQGFLECFSFTQTILLSTASKRFLRHDPFNWCDETFLLFEAKVVEQCRLIQVESLQTSLALHYGLCFEWLHRLIKVFNQRTVFLNRSSIYCRREVDFNFGVGGKSGLEINQQRKPHSSSGFGIHKSWWKFVIMQTTVVLELDYLWLPPFLQISWITTNPSP